MDHIGIIFPYSKQFGCPNLLNLKDMLGLYSDSRATPSELQYEDELEKATRGQTERGPLFSTARFKVGVLEVNGFCAGRTRITSGSIPSFPTDRRQTWTWFRTVTSVTKALGLKSLDC